MRALKYKKIAVVGNAGSGKTTLSFQLYHKLGLPLYHLDRYCWKPQWEKVPLEDFYALHNELCARGAWIIEGSYIKILNERVLAADLIVFLDVPRTVCLWRVLKRSIFYWGKVIPGNPGGCEQRILSSKFLDFLHWIWTFNGRYRQAIITMLDDAAARGKQVYIFTSSRDCAHFIDTIVPEFHKDTV